MVSCLFLFALPHRVVFDFLLSFEGGSVVHVDGVVLRGEVVFGLVEIGLCLPDASDGIEGQVVGEDLLLMGFQGRHEFRMGGLVVRRKVDEEGNVYHVVVEGRGGVVVLHIFAMVGEVNHGFQVQVGLGVFEDVLHHLVVIGDGKVVVMVGIFFGNAQFVPQVHGHPGNVGVVAAVDVDEDDPLSFANCSTFSSYILDTFPSFQKNTIIADEQFIINSAKSKILPSS